MADATSAYRMVGMQNAAGLVADGEGDYVSTTVAAGHGGKLTAELQLPVSPSLGFGSASFAFW